MRKQILSLCLFTTLASAQTTPATNAVVGVRVSPTTTTLRIGQSRKFTATVSNSANQSVAWLVNDTPGGTAALGKIDATGNYVTPAALPVNTTITIKAVSEADKTKFATAVITLQNAIPTISSLTPNQINTGLAYTILIEGANFLPTSTVKWDQTIVPATFVSSTQLKLTGKSALAAGTQIQITVVNPDPGGAASGARTLTVLEPVTVTVNPANRNVRGGDTTTFSASVAHNSNRKVTWAVNGVNGGNATIGTIDAIGLYAAPVMLPSGPQDQQGTTPNLAASTVPGFVVNISATSEADPSASALATATLFNPIPVITSLAPTSVKQGSTTFAVNGTGFAKGAGVTVAGKPGIVLWKSATQLQVTATVEVQATGLASVKVSNPDPGASVSKPAFLAVTPAQQLLSHAAASRFLEQATFGPTPASIAHLQEIGIDAWINEQFNLPSSSYPDPIDDAQGLGDLQRSFFNNAFNSPDQLRQRLAFALSQIAVTSGVKTGRYVQMVGYHRMLLGNAFGNYKNVLHDVTLHPAMGVFLDMVNNDKANPVKKTVANENYARELLQLFSVGLVTLNPNGTPVPGAAPPYSEDTVKEFAKVFTGWTFAPAPGYQSHWRNPAYYLAAMVPFEEHHDQTAKTLLNNEVVFAGHTAQADIDQALNNIFSHSNVGPFIALRLIQRFTTSAPSAAYVGRVAAAFNGPVRGDLKNVIKAILLDPEAGNAPYAPLPAAQGKLSEPVLFSVRLLRALDAAASQPSLAGLTQAMGQNLFFAPSVFNYFSPGYRIPYVGAVAPEFQGLNAATSLARVNYVYRAVRNGVGNAHVDLTPFIDLASDPTALVEAVNHALLRGEMTQAQKNIITTAVTAATDNTTRARNALYLTGASSQYQVER